MSGLKESQQKEVVLHDIQYSTFLTVQMFLYSSKLEFNGAENMEELLSVATLYMLEDLKALCGEEIKKFVGTDNVHDVMRQAQLYDVPKLTQFCRKFMNESGMYPSILFDTIKVNGESEQSTGLFLDDRALRKQFKTYPLENNQRYIKELRLDQCEKTDGIQVKLNVNHAAHFSFNTCVELSFEFYKSSRGRPLTNMIPYLSSPIHLILIPEQRTNIMFYHSHGYDASRISGSIQCNSESDHSSHEDIDGDSFGPNVIAAFNFPTPGKWIIIGQTAINDSMHGTLLISVFTVHVKENFDSSVKKEELSLTTIKEFIYVIALLVLLGLMYYGLGWN